jgi:adenylate kinase
MRVAVTGTPGTGKTSATTLLEDDPDFDLSVVHLNERIAEEDLYTDVDETRDSKMADLDAVRDFLADREDVLVESHLAHEIGVDRAVVLRCHPERIEQRLKDRGESSESARENAEAEALDVILSEAVDNHDTDSVYELPTTTASPQEVAEAIREVVSGEREPKVGRVSYVDYL